MKIDDGATETRYVVAYRGAINFWFAISLDGPHDPATVCDAVTIRATFYFILTVGQATEFTTESFISEFLRNYRIPCFAREVWSKI